MPRTNRYEDDDASHLPPGMKRVGYDADTEKYTFREGNDLWLGEPGSFYGGRLKWAGKALESQGDKSSTKHTNYSGHKATVKSLRENARDSTQNISGSRRKVADNSWGVPVASISDTGAQPPDGPNGIQMRVRHVKRVATLKVTALGIFNRRSRKGSQ